MSQPSAFAINDFPIEEFHEAHKARKEKKVLHKETKRHGYEKTIKLFASEENVRCRRGVRLLVGPVVGKVTSTSAIILVEIDACAEVNLHLVPESGDSIVIDKILEENLPSTFYVTDLKPDTKYQIAIG